MNQRSCNPLNPRHSLEVIDCESACVTRGISLKNIVHSPEYVFESLFQKRIHMCTCSGQEKSENKEQVRIVLTTKQMTEHARINAMPAASA